MCVAHRLQEAEVSVEWPSWFLHTATESQGRAAACLCPETSRACSCGGVLRQDPKPVCSCVSRVAGRALGVWPPVGMHNGFRVTARREH